MRSSIDFPLSQLPPFRSSIFVLTIASSEINVLVTQVVFSMQYLHHPLVRCTKFQSLHSIQEIQEIPLGNPRRLVIDHIQSPSA